MRAPDGLLTVMASCLHRPKTSAEVVAVLAGGLQACNAVMGCSAAHTCGDGQLELREAARGMGSGGCRCCCCGRQEHRDRCSSFTQRIMQGERGADATMTQQAEGADHGWCRQGHSLQPCMNLPAAAVNFVSGFKAQVVCYWQGAMTVPGSCGGYERGWSASEMCEGHVVQRGRGPSVVCAWPPSELRCWCRSGQGLLA